MREWSPRGGGPAAVFSSQAVAIPSETSASTKRSKSFQRRLSGDRLFQFRLEQLTLWLLRLSLRTHAFSVAIGIIGVQSATIVAQLRDLYY